MPPSSGVRRRRRGRRPQPRRVAALHETDDRPRGEPPRLVSEPLEARRVGRTFEVRAARVPARPLREHAGHEAAEGEVHRRRGVPRRGVPRAGCAQGAGMRCTTARYQFNLE